MISPIQSRLVFCIGNNIKWRRLMVMGVDHSGIRTDLWPKSVGIVQALVLYVSAAVTLALIVMIRAS